MRTRLLQAFIVFAASAIGGAGLFTGAPAEAAYVQYSPTVCLPSSNASSYSVSGGHINGPTSGTVTWTCPMLDDTNLRHDAVNYLTISVYDNVAANITAQSCVQYFNSSGGICDGNTVTSTAAGAQNLTFDRSGTNELSYWTATYYADFPYLTVNLSNAHMLLGVYASS